MRQEIGGSPDIEQRAKQAMCRPIMSASREASSPIRELLSINNMFFLNSAIHVLNKLIFRIFTMLLPKYKKKKTNDKFFSPFGDSANFHLLIQGFPHHW